MRSPRLTPNHVRKATSTAPIANVPGLVANASSHQVKNPGMKPPAMRMVSDRNLNGVENSAARSV
jgi:hypothetical protein